MRKTRNYKREYKKYHGKPAQIKRRAQRNKSRTKLRKAGRVRKGDGKDVHHKDHNTANMRPGNLRVVPKSRNRKDNKRKVGKLMAQLGKAIIWQDVPAVKDWEDLTPEEKVVFIQMAFPTDENIVVSKSGVLPEWEPVFDAAPKEVETL